MADSGNAYMAKSIDSKQFLWLGNGCRIILSLLTLSIEEKGFWVQLILFNCVSVEMEKLGYI